MIYLNDIWLYIIWIALCIIYNYRTGNKKNSIMVVELDLRESIPIVAVEK